MCMLVASHVHAVYMFQALLSIIHVTMHDNVHSIWCWVNDGCKLVM